MRRIVTGHDENGHAVIRSIDELQTQKVPSGDATFATIWSSAEVPVDLNDESDGSVSDVGLTLKVGSVIRIVDYGIVISGEVELELDNGAVEACRAGDVIVQRGTMHLWRNVSADTPCRIVFVLTESAGPYVHNGEPLEELTP